MIKSLAMMLTVALIFVLPLPVQAATDQEIVASFQKYLTEQLTPIYETYKGTHNILGENKYWYKQTTALTPNYSIDVEKTNSLVSPIVGTLKIAIIRFHSDIFASIAAAEQASANKLFIDGTKEFQFIFAYQNEKWILTKVKEKLYLIPNHSPDWINVGQKSLFDYLKSTDKIRK